MENILTKPSSPISTNSTSHSTSTTLSSSTTMCSNTSTTNIINNNNINPTDNYPPRLKKVLKSYQLSAKKSLNGPDWISSRYSLPTKTSSLTSLPTTSLVKEKDDPKPLSSSPLLISQQQVLNDKISHDTSSRDNHVTNNSKKGDMYDPFLAPPPFPIQQPPIFTTADQNCCETTETILQGETISCFMVGGEKRLCLPQILTTVLRDFSLPQINRVCDDLQIFCSRCTNDQLEALKLNAIIPASAPSCGLITKTDAERLCAALLHSNPPKSSFHLNISSNGIGKKLFCFTIYHQCFGKCTGLYIPSLYVEPSSSCVECLQCHGLFPLQKFVCHSHRSNENRTCHWGFDSSNWRSYILLLKDKSYSDDQIKELEKHLDEMKSRFNFKRKHKDTNEEQCMSSLNLEKMRAIEMWKNFNGHMLSGGDVLRTMIFTRSIDLLNSAEVLRSLDPLSGGAVSRALNRLTGDELLRLLYRLTAGELLVSLDQLTDGDLLRSLDRINGGEVLRALENSKMLYLNTQRHLIGRQIKRTDFDTINIALDEEKKRSLDPANGLSFGQKRPFEDVDNGLNGFSKRTYNEVDYTGGLGGFWWFVKRNFDEIDKGTVKRINLNEGSNDFVKGDVTLDSQISVKTEMESAKGLDVKQKDKSSKSTLKI